MLRDSPIDPRHPASVRVSASTSNLGSGFDVLGLALGLWLELAADPEPALGARIASRRGEARQWPEEGRDLLIAAFDRAWIELGGGPTRPRLAIDSEIPVGRGLGSSGAAIAAGLLMAAALAPREVDRETLLAWGIEIEGHPDNVAPSLLGGLVAVDRRGSGAPLPVRLPVAPGLAFLVAWPAQPLETRRARAVLPRTVALEDAVANARALTSLVAGLASGDAGLLGAGERDRWHVPHRLPLIAGASQAIAAAREAGAYLATLSGSGSGILAIAPPERAAAVAGAMEQALRAASGSASARELAVVREPPRVVQS